jgi:hypothetical protein
MLAILLLTAAMSSTAQTAALAPRDSVEPLCLSIEDSTRSGRGRVYVRLDTAGTVAFSDAAAPSTPPDHYWSWRRIGDSAVVRFRGIDSGEEMRFAVGRVVQRVARTLYWANDGGGSKSDSVTMRVVACPIARSDPRTR